MKKVILTLISFFVIGFSFTYAQPSNSFSLEHSSINKSAHLLSNADTSLIFSGNVDALVLDENEMMNTQGFGFWSSFLSIGNAILDTIKNPFVAIPALMACGTFLSPGCIFALAF